MMRTSDRIKALEISWDRFQLDFSKRTYVMGILNRTPDSFSDGARYMREEDAVKRAFEMAAEGAGIIDVGGESSRPGAEPVTINEELDRTIPVIKKIAREIAVPVSIDTCKSEVAKEALKNGASMINDITGLRGDNLMREVAAEFGVPVVVMHMKGTPGTMQADPRYDSLIDDILSSLQDSIRLATEVGVDENMIIVDPGIGFGKTAGHNLAILNNLDSFKVLNRPILVGVSRKSYIANTLRAGNISNGDIEAGGRLVGTISSSAIAILRGANILRAHDIKEAVQAARVADAIIRS